MALKQITCRHLRRGEDHLGNFVLYNQDIGKFSYIFDYFSTSYSSLGTKMSYLWEYSDPCLKPWLRYHQRPGSVQFCLRRYTENENIESRKSIIWLEVEEEFLDNEDGGCLVISIDQVNQPFAHGIKWLLRLRFGQGLLVDTNTTIHTTLLLRDQQ